MKGIILAGGTGSRLFPLTTAISKQLLPVFDKPLIYYPLSVLMLAGIREILLITTPRDVESFKVLLGTGEHLGLDIKYACQEKPNGLAEAFLIGEDFIGEDNCSLVLGDNLFWGQGFTQILQRCSDLSKGAIIFGYPVKDPERFGVISFDHEKRVTDLQEKPSSPKSNFAATGLYFYDNQVVEFARSLTPSVRGELEITDLNRIYLDRGELSVELLGRGFAWLDTGTHQSLSEASTFVQTLEMRQGFKIACLEEIAYEKGWIGNQELKSAIIRHSHNSYGSYLESLLK